MRIKFSEQQNGTEGRPVHATIWSPRLEARSIRRLVQNGPEHIRILGAILQQERSTKVWIRKVNATAKRRFRTELRQHELFNRIVENSVSGPDAGISRAAG